MKLFRIILLMVCIMPLFQNVYAHQLRPAIVSLEFAQNGSVKIEINTNLESIIAGIGPNHEDTDDAPQAAYYNELRLMGSEKLKQVFAESSKNLIAQLNLMFDQSKAPLTFENLTVPEVGDVDKARLSQLQLSASVPVSTQQVTWQYPANFGNNVAHFYYAESPKERTSHWLTEGSVSPVFDLKADFVPKSFGQVASEYTVLGFEHIIPKGLDHILFVLGIFLLSARLKPLLWQVTTFTVAHSITLGLTIYGLISLSPDIVEPLIALSIAYVGIENILAKELKPWRVIIIFIFGLLHGMGFAGVLSELGLPESDFATALLFFNIGVEVGQLAVIAITFALVFWLLKNPQRYRQWVIIPGSLMISVVGLYWTYERVFL